MDADTFNDSGATSLAILMKDGNAHRVHLTVNRFYFAHPKAIRSDADAFPLPHSSASARTRPCDAGDSPGRSSGTRSTRETTLPPFDSAGRPQVDRTRSLCFTHSIPHRSMRPEASPPRSPQEQRRKADAVAGLRVTSLAVSSNQTDVSANQVITELYRV